MEKQLDVRIQNKIDSKTNWDAATFTSLTGEMYIYQSTDMPKIRFGDGVSTVKNLQDVDKDEGSSATVVAVPSTQTFTYNGSSQGLSYNTSAMQVVSGQASAVVPGSYSATFQLNSGYKWSDNSTSNKTVSWSIAKAESTISIATNSITLNQVLTTVKTTVSLVGASSYTISNGDTTVCSAVRNTSDNKLEVTPGTKNGSTTLTLTTVPDTYYDAVSIPVTVVNNAAVSNTLENNSWSVIAQVARKGQASSTWNVGDTKKITLASNTYDRQTIGGDFYVYIVDFDKYCWSGMNNHIVFQGFKNVSTNSYVALVDNQYPYSTGGSYDPETNGFVLSYDQGTVDGYSDFTGNWTDLAHRTLNRASDEHRSMLSCFPTDLQACMLDMCNIDQPEIHEVRSFSGGFDSCDWGDSWGQAPTGTYLAIPSSKEMLGEYLYGSNVSQDYYVGTAFDQFQFYANGNYTLINRHTTPSQTVGCVFWVRDILFIEHEGHSGYFYTYTSGLAMQSGNNTSAGFVQEYNPGYSLGICPIFCVG